MGISHVNDRDWPVGDCPLWMAPALQVQIDALSTGRLQSSVRKREIRRTCTVE